MSLSLQIWLWYGLFCSWGGWALGMGGMLNPAGCFLVQAAFFITMGWLIWVAGRKRPNLRAVMHRLRRRFFPDRMSQEGLGSWRRCLPPAFFFLAVLTLFAGILYPPNNFDALSYRFPRVLHWLQAEAWHWIHTTNSRMNTRATGHEWMALPQICLAASDRGVFMINFISYLCLPGALFALLRELGASGRMAWLWMWTFPASYGYLLQAASAANDSLAALYSVAAALSALRFLRNGRSVDLWFCLVASALLTGVKASNLPLLLPVLLLLLLAWRRYPGQGKACFVFFLLVVPSSFAASAVLNYIYIGDWTGTSLEAFRPIRNVWAGLFGNFLQITAQTLNPPVLPSARIWDERLCSFLPDALRESLHHNFMYGFKLGLTELPTEGAGISCAFAVCLVLALLAPRTRAAVPRGPQALTQTGRFLFFLGSWIAALFLASKSSVFGASRLFLPYFPLLLAGIMLRPSWDVLSRQKIFRFSVFLLMTTSGFAVVMEPSRPLWPAQAVLERLSFSQNPFVTGMQSRALSVYSNYGQRAEVFAPLRTLLPPQESRVGFFNGGDDPIASLWKPYGSIQIAEFTPSDNSATIRCSGVRYVMIGERAAKDLMATTLEAWAAQVGGRIVAETTLYPAVSRGAERWALILLNAESGMGHPP